MTTPQPVVYRLTKIEVAVDQLDWAIRMLLDHKAYVPAIGLAGAAEDILRHFVGTQAAFYKLKTSIATEFGLTETEVACKHLNRLRNWIKHANPGTKDEFMDFEQSDLEAEAICMIVRALHNLELYDRTGPSERPRFEDWLQRTRPDLTAMETRA